MYYRYSTILSFIALFCFLQRYRVSPFPLLKLHLSLDDGGSVACLAIAFLRRKKVCFIHGLRRIY